MKKLILPAALACLVLISCQKEAPAKSTSQTSQASTPLVYSLLTNDIVGADFTGFPVLNLRTERMWKIASGTIALTVTSEGVLKALGVYDFAIQNNSATISPAAIYSISIDPMWPGDRKDTASYKITCKPQGNSPGYIFYATAKVGFTIDGEYSITIDNGAITDSN